MIEDCGIIAVYRPEGAAELVHRGLFALQHRGQEAAGICGVDASNDISHYKGRGLVADALPTYDLKRLQTDRAIGHVRYSTVAADRAENIQPFVAKTPFGPFAVSHNGNLKNTAEVTAELETHGSLLSTTMDSELFAHLLALSGKSTLEEGLRDVATKVIGAYSLTMICNGRLLALRDPHGVRPLVLGASSGPAGAGRTLAVASETAALKRMGLEYIREIDRGELVEIGPEGIKSTQLLTPAAEAAPCVFELVYFARPDSTVFGQGVHSARRRMGAELALQDDAVVSEIKRAAKQGTGLDTIVVPVPDSGFPAAMGYAQHSGLVLENAIVRSHYVGRTFILPDQDSRSHSVHMKLSVIEEVVAGKRVILVDDSIVRGNTSRIIVEMVRQAGATEVWMRIASPPLRWPCYLGIDTPTREELAVNRLGTVEAVGDWVGAENLRYLDLDRLKNATLRAPFCFGCMNGAYPL